MTKKTKKVTDKEVVNSSIVTLGDSKSEEGYESSITGESFYRLKYGNSVNMYALVHPDFLYLSEHWFKIGEDNYKVVCAVHETGDNNKIHSRWGYSGGCRLCGIKQQLYDDAPKESKDVIDVNKRKVAGKIQAKGAYYIFAIQGDADTKRGQGKNRGKRVITPYFENENVRKLTISKDAFEKKFYPKFKELKITANDVPGLPVNFAGGKGSGDYSQIQEVTFYQSHRLKNLPKTPSDFGSLGIVNFNYLNEVADKLEAALPEMLSGVMRKGKATKKKKG